MVTASGWILQREDGLLAAHFPNDSLGDPRFKTVFDWLAKP